MNKISLFSIFYSLIFILYISSCSHGDDNTQRVIIERLDKELAGYIDMDSAAREDFIAYNKEVLTGYGQITGRERDVVLDDITLTDWATSQAATTFSDEVRTVFPTLDAEETAIGSILSRSKEAGLELGPEKFVAVLWSLTNSIVVNDSVNVVYIALNHYLGADSPYYAGWPEHLRARKVRAMIPVDVAEALVAISHPYRPNGDNTILSRLLYEGAIAAVKEYLVPEASTADILGLNPDVLADIEKNEYFLWNGLINDNGLYSTDADLMSNLFDRRRPTSTRISPDAPGRSACYIGYRIVKDYMKRNPDVRLDYLLSTEFYEGGTEILRQSGYQPGK